MNTVQANNTINQKPINRLHILIVEDDNNTRKTIQVMLHELGITQVFEAPDGATAAEFVDAGLEKMDLIISDWNMPNKTGFEFLKEVRANALDVPFLMVTARADENSVLEAKSADVTGYLRKPFTLNELKTKIFSILK